MTGPLKASIELRMLSDLAMAICRDSKSVSGSSTFSGLADGQYFTEEMIKIGIISDFFIFSIFDYPVVLEDISDPPN